MKGRLFKPFSKLEDISKEKVSHSRPWAAQSQQSTTYMWRSSIPDKWIKIKGSKAFKHVSETGSNKNTLDFLKSNQKYISTIADPRTKSPSNGSFVQSKETSRQPSRENSCFQSQEIIIRDFNMSSSVSKPLSPLANIFSEEAKGETSGKISVPIPENGKKLLASSSLKNFKLDINEKREDYCVTKYSLPKLLVKAEKKQSALCQFKNKKVNEFLNRFSQNFGMIASGKERKGVNGWKLVAVKKRL